VLLDQIEKPDGGYFIFDIYCEKQGPGYETWDERHKLAWRAATDANLESGNGDGDHHRFTARLDLAPPPGADERGGVAATAAGFPVTCAICQAWIRVRKVA
jgi:hypothetical protein